MIDTPLYTYMPFDLKIDCKESDGRTLKIEDGFLDVFPIHFSSKLSFKKISDVTDYDTRQIRGQSYKNYFLLVKKILL